MVSPIAPVIVVLRLAAVTVLLGLTIVADLAPLTHGAAGWMMPDLLLCVVACMIVRRPQMLPAWLILTAALVRDLLSGAPVGLGAAAMLIGAEILRPEPGEGRAVGLIPEWLRFAAVAAGTLLLPSLLLWVTFFALPNPQALAIRWVMTVAAYPLVVALLRIGHGTPRLRARVQERAA